MKNSLVLALTMLLFGATASAQTMDGSPTATRARSDKSVNTISRHLTDTTVQPLANAVSFVRSASYQRSESRTVSTDEQGISRINDIASGIYYDSPNVPGYLS